MPNYQKPERKDNRKTVFAIAVYLSVLTLTGIFLLFELWFIWVAISAAGFIILSSWYTRINPHKILTRLVALNVVLDVFAFAVWATFPSTQWSIHQLNFSTVGTEATLAAGLFALTLIGLIKKHRCAPFLAISITVTQRSFATYVFFPSTAIAVTLIWSLLIIHFAYKDIKSKNI